MIISYQNKFIFIHCRKTAGSSISMYLSNSLGPRDIQLSAVSETLQAGYRIPAEMWDSSGVSPLIKHSMRTFFGRAALHRYMASKIKNLYRAGLGEKPQHASATAVKKLFPDEWAAFTKFCVVRNPFSLAVSDYNWRTRKLKQKPSFLEYIEALKARDTLGGIVPVGFYNNWRQYTIDDQIQVDRVVKFENLVADLGDVFSELNIPFEGDLPNLKNLRRGGGRQRDYRGYYNRRTVDIVADLYSQEIAAFGYTF